MGIAACHMWQRVSGQESRDTGESRNALKCKKPFLASWFRRMVLDKLKAWYNFSS